MEDYIMSAIFVYIPLTAISYLFFPLLKLIRNHGKFERKRAKKIALWNSIIVGAIFCVLTATSQTGTTWSAGPAFLYYFINYSILEKKKGDLSEREVFEDEEHVDPVQLPLISLQTDSVDAETETPASAPKIEFCRKCGNKLPENASFCGKCGTKIV